MQESGHGSIGSKVEQGAQTLKEKTSSAASSVAGQARASANQGKERLASRTGDIAGAVRRMGQEEQSLSRYTDAIGSQLDDFASYIRNHDIRDVIQGTTSLAHRQPALFLGGAFALGLIAARFVKSSAASSDQSHPRSLASEYPQGSPDPLPRYPLEHDIEERLDLTDVDASPPARFDTPQEGAHGGARTQPPFGPGSGGQPTGESQAQSSWPATPYGTTGNPGTGTR